MSSGTKAARIEARWRWRWWRGKGSEQLSRVELRLYGGGGGTGRPGFPYAAVPASNPYLEIVGPCQPASQQLFFSLPAPPLPTVSPPMRA